MCHKCQDDILSSNRLIKSYNSAIEKTDNFDKIKLMVDPEFFTKSQNIPTQGDRPDQRSEGDKQLTASILEKLTNLTSSQGPQTQASMPSQIHEQEQVEEPLALPAEPEERLAYLNQLSSTLKV